MAVWREGGGRDEIVNPAFVGLPCGGGTVVNPEENKIKVCRYININ